MEYPRTLGETRAYLRSSIEAQGKSARALAKELGTTGANLSRLMNEPGARPRFELAARMQARLGVPIAFWSLPEQVTDAA